MTKVMLHVLSYFAPNGIVEIMSVIMDGRGIRYIKD